MKKYLLVSIVLLVACSGSKQSSEPSTAVLSNAATKNVGTAKVSWNGQTELTRNLRYSKEGMSFDSPITLPEKLPESISLSLPQEYTLFQTAAMNEKDLVSKTDSHGIIVVGNLSQYFPQNNASEATLYLQSKDGITLSIQLRLPPKALEFSWLSHNLPKRSIANESDNYEVIAQVDIRNPNKSPVEMSLPAINALVSQKITRYSLGTAGDEICHLVVSTHSDASRNQEANLFLIDADFAFDGVSFLPGVKTFSFAAGESKHFLLVSDSSLVKQLHLEGSDYGAGSTSRQNTGGYAIPRFFHGDQIPASSCSYSQSDLPVGDWKERPTISLNTDSDKIFFRYADLLVNDDPAVKEGNWFESQTMFF